MLKMIAFFVVLFLIGFFMVDDSRNVTISAFGFDVTFSVVLLSICCLFVAYLLYLLGKPFSWIGRFKAYCSRTKVCRQDSFLTDVLVAVADKNTASVKGLLKKGRGLYQKQDMTWLLAQAVLAPSVPVFEALYQMPKTRLAGLKGLVDMALDKGDFQEANRLIEKDFDTFQHVSWVAREHFRLQIIHSDWAGALKSLEAVYKNRLMTKSEYMKQKALILLQVNRVKEAVALDDTHPAIILAWAAQNPQQAKSVLSKGYKKTPCLDIFEAYYRLIQDEAPAKRVQLIEKLVAPHPASRISVYALAYAATDAHLYGMAKEQMEIYFKSFPVTKTTALLMVQIEREGWHHETAAHGWEEKAVSAEDKATWVCSACGREANACAGVCTACNTFGTLTPCM